MRGMANFAVPSGFNESEIAFVLDDVILPLIRGHAPEAIFFNSDRIGFFGRRSDHGTRPFQSGACRRRQGANRGRTMTPLALGDGGYNPWSVARCRTGIWAVRTILRSGSASPKRGRQFCATSPVAIFGFNSSPYNCWMAERGLHIFDLRYRQAQKNALQLAEFLQGQPNVLRVIYPKSKDHPDFEMAKKLLKNGFGSMVSFVLDGGRKEANAFLRAAKNIPYCPTLGDVATTVIIPAVSSHRKLPREKRLALGIEDNLVRVSVGIENFELIKDDFSIALKACAS